MPWICPACGIHIEHEQDRPLAKKVYRCHVCRLELVLDAITDTLVLVPFSASVPPEPLGT
jgi:hypothetical protein